MDGSDTIGKHNLVFSFLLQLRMLFFCYFYYTHEQTLYETKRKRTYIGWYSHIDTYYNDFYKYIIEKG